MECNKEEAIKAKEIALRKLEAHDYRAARKFVLKAQHLYPELDNIPQILAVCEVHYVAQDKLDGGEINWYRILQLEPSVADEAIIKRQYRKLALLLHPDKNMFSGAEAAFKLLVEANAALCDKNRRSNLDARIKRSTEVKTAQSNESGYSCKMQQPDNRDTTFWTICNHCVRCFRYKQSYLNQVIWCSYCNKSFHAVETPSPENNESHTYGMASASNPRSSYWSYTDIGGQGATLNERNFTPNSSSYSATGGGSTKTNMFGSSNYSFSQSQNPSTQQNIASQTSMHGSMDGLPKSDGHGFWHDSKVYQNSYPDAHGVKLDQQNFARNSFSHAGMDNSAKADYSGIPKDGLESEANIKQEPQRNMKASSKLQESEAEVEDLISEKKNENSTRTKASRRRKNEEDTKDKKTHMEEKREALRKLEQKKRDRAVKAESKLKPKKRMRKVRDSDSSDGEFDDPTLQDVLSDEQMMSSGEVRRSTRTKRNISYIVQGSDDEDFVDFQPSKRSTKIKLDSGIANGSHTLSVEDKMTTTLNMQDDDRRGKSKIKDSHSFDKKKGDENLKQSNIDVDAPTCNDSSESSSKVKTYVVPDPDFYKFDEDRTVNKFAVGQIWAAYDERDGMPRYYCKIKYLRKDPFKCKITWLELKPVSNDQKAWDTKKLAAPCGNFEVGNTQTFDEINFFSHMLISESKEQGTVKIFPKKGEVWSIFKNSNPEQQIPKHGKDAKLEYDMVEILSDFCENMGIEVVFLTKVDGFKVIFKKTENSFNISPTELRRFSHNVPANRKFGQEQNVPKDSVELDPAALPLELIHFENKKAK